MAEQYRIEVKESRKGRKERVEIAQASIRVEFVDKDIWPFWCARVLQIPKGLTQKEASYGEIIISACLDGEEFDIFVKIVCGHSCILVVIVEKCHRLNFLFEKVFPKRRDYLKLIGFISDTANLVLQMCDSKECSNFSVRMNLSQVSNEGKH